MSTIEAPAQSDSDGSPESADVPVRTAWMSWKAGLALAVLAVLGVGGTWIGADTGSRSVPTRDGHSRRPG